MKIMYLATFSRNFTSTVEKVYVEDMKELRFGKLVDNFKYCETEREGWEYIKNHAQVAYDNAKFESDSKLEELNKIEEILKILK
jgi:hypothetical protein